MSTHLDRVANGRPHVFVRSVVASEAGSNIGIRSSWGEAEVQLPLPGDFNVATSYSDLAATVPHEVFIWRYDVDNADNDDDVFTGGEDDILWLRVATVDGLTDLQTLISRY